LSKLLDFKREVWLDKVKEMVPKKAVEINLKAFQTGIELAGC